MADDVIIQVERPDVQAPVSVNFTGAGFLADIENGFRKLTDSIKSGSDEALTAIFLSGMFIVAGVYLWRRV